MEKKIWKKNGMHGDVTKTRQSFNLYPFGSSQMLM